MHLPRRKEIASPRSGLGFSRLLPVARAFLPTHLRFCCTLTIVAEAGPPLLEAEPRGVPERTEERKRWSPLSEQPAYPRMKRAPNAKELADWYTPTQKEREHAAATCRGEQSILSFLVLYKAFQRPGYFPSPDDIPAVIVEHIRACVQVSSEVTVSYPPRTLYRHQRAIRAYLGVKPYDEQAERLASETIIRAAQVMDNPADLLNAAIEELVRAHYELPAFSRLSRLTAHLRTQVNDQYFQMVAARLGEETSAPLHTFLLTRNVSTRHSELQRLKAIPKSATLSHLQDMLDHLVWIESFTGIERLLDGIPRAKIKHFAAQARVLDVAELEEVALAKRQTLVCCLLLETQVATRDAIIEMFLKRMARIHTRGKEALELLHQQHRATTEHLLSVFTDVLHTTQEVADDAALGKQVREVLEQEEGGIQGLLEKTEKLASHNGNNYFPLLWQFYHSHRRTLFRLVHLLDIRSTTQDQTVRAALTFLVEHEQHRGKYLPNVIDLSFANEQWHRTIYVRRKKQVLLDRRHLEVCIFTHVAAELKAGDFCVVGSEQFADYREQLLPWETCEPLVAEYCSEVGRPATGKALVEHLKTQLTRIGREIDQGVPTNGGQLSISPKGELILRRGERREAPCEVIRLEAKLTKELPERNVLDILCNVEHWVHWTRHLGPASGSDPKIKDIIERYIITAFCYGCNLGARQTARHMRGIVTAHELSFTHRRHITAEKLDAAIRDIINCYNAFPLPKLWGTGKLAAADGTKLDLYEENLLSEYHIRYGGYGGIAYHHISDTYIALFTHFIACGVCYLESMVMSQLSHSGALPQKYCSAVWK